MSAFAAPQPLASALLRRLCVAVCRSAAFGIVPALGLSVKAYLFPCSRVALFFFFSFFFLCIRANFLCLANVELLPPAPKARDPPALTHLSTHGFSVLSVWPDWKPFKNVRMSSSLLPCFFHDRFISTWCSDSM